MEQKAKKTDTLDDLITSAVPAVVAKEAAKFLAQDTAGKSTISEKKQRIREMAAEIVEMILEMNSQAPAELSRKAVDDTNDLIYYITMFERALETAYEPDTVPRALRRLSGPR